MTDERDDDNGSWARTSLIIEPGPLTVDEIGRRLGRPTVGKKTKERWIADLESDSDLPFTDQLVEAERFFADNIETLAELAVTCEMDLFMSWRPRTGQDHAVFSRALVQLLGRIGADVTLDTWTGCTFCEPGAVEPVEALIVTDGPWALTSLGVRSAGLSVDAISRKLGQPSACWKAEDLWAVDFESGSDTPLADEFATVERFLGDNIVALEELAATGETDLSVRWRPKAGQDHALFSPALVRLLGRAGATIALDTWTGCEMCVPDDDPAG